MTCVVSLIDNGKVYMGADSAAVTGSHIRIRIDPKVFIIGNFIIGFTSSFRMGQLLRYDFIPPEHTEGRNLYEYMVVPFINKVRQCLRAGGFAKQQDGVETEAYFLLATLVDYLELIPIISLVSIKYLTMLLVVVCIMR